MYLYTSILYILNFRTILLQIEDLIPSMVSTLDLRYPQYCFNSKARFKRSNFINFQDYYLHNKIENMVTGYDFRFNEDVLRGTKLFCIVENTT